MRLVTNTSPLIALAKLGMLSLLGEEVVIPGAVFAELTESTKEYADELGAWCRDKVLEVRDRQAVGYLALILDRGEAEVIALAEELKTPIVLIDDIKARRIAKLRGLNVVGTLGILLDAKDKGLIRELKPFLDELMNKKIRLSTELYNHALVLAHESQGTSEP
jgi:predicted nucleic acid-binding protein